jgi:hypothetical protein
MRLAVRCVKAIDTGERVVLVLPNNSSSLMLALSPTFRADLGKNGQKKVAFYIDSPDKLLLRE